MMWGSRGVLELIVADSGSPSIAAGGGEAAALLTPPTGAAMESPTWRAGSSLCPFLQPGALTNQGFPAPKRHTVNLSLLSCSVY